MLALSMTALSGHAQNADTDDDADELRQSQIVVTGTRSTDRTALETAVPVDVFPVAELTEAVVVKMREAATAEMAANRWGNRLSIRSPLCRFGIRRWKGKQLNRSHNSDEHL